MNGNGIGTKIRKSRTKAEAPVEIPPWPKPETASLPVMGREYCADRPVQAHEHGDIVRKVLCNMVDVCEIKYTLECFMLVHAELEDRLARTTAALQSKSREIEQRKEELARIASELIVTEQRERNRLAQLLHDDLQQLLLSAKYTLHLAEKTNGGENEPLNRTVEILDAAILASRSLTMQLSPPVLREKGLAAGLKWLANWMNEKHGLVVDLVLNAAAESRREEICILLFQAVRELLFNVIKHSGVKRAHMELAMPEPCCIAITVSDEGTGFDSAAISSAIESNATGFGLPAIRERMSQLGGRIEVWSAPGHGSRISLVCPVPPIPDEPKLNPSANGQRTDSRRICGNAHE